MSIMDDAATVFAAHRYQLARKSEMHSPMTE
jgi:hypothetical protein